MTSPLHFYFFSVPRASYTAAYQLLLFAIGFDELCSNKTHVVLYQKSEYELDFTFDLSDNPPLP